MNGKCLRPKRALRVTKVLVLSDGPQKQSIWESYYRRLGDRRCIYAHPAYILFLSALYDDPAELFIYEERDTFVYYPYFRRRLTKLGLRIPDGVDFSRHVDFHSSWYYGGPLTNGSEVPPGFAARFVEAFRYHARQSGCISEFVRLDPNSENCTLYPPQELLFNRETVYIELAHRTRDAIWHDFKDSNRRAINRAQREGIVVMPIGTQDAGAWTRFAGIYADEMVRKNAPAHLRFDEAFFHRLREVLPQNLCLMIAMKGDEFCGGHLIIFDEATAYLFLSATSFAYWPARVNNLLWAEAIFWAQDHGRRRYDLQGGRAGVFKFKSLFAPTRGKFYTLNAVHDPALFESIVACNAQSGTGSQGERFPALSRPRVSVRRPAQPSIWITYPGQER